MQIVGSLSENIINLFNLSYEKDSKILLTKDRKKHMLKHKNEFSDFEKTYSRIDEIIQNPEFVGMHPSGESIEFIKRLDETVLVAVRLNKNLNVKTMYVISETKLNNYVKSGRTKKIVL